MKAAEIRADLYKLIEQTEDVSILKALKVLLKKQVKSEKDFWDDLPEALKSDIDKGLEEIENDEVMTHNEDMKKYEKWI